MAGEALKKPEWPLEPACGAHSKVPRWCGRMEGQQTLGCVALGNSYLKVNVQAANLYWDSWISIKTGSWAEFCFYLYCLRLNMQVIYTSMCEQILFFLTFSRILRKSNEQPCVKTQYRVQGPIANIVLEWVLWALDLATCFLILLLTSL